MKKLATWFQKNKIYMALLLVSVSVSAKAATLDDVVTAINALTSYINSAVNASVTTASKLIYANNPSQIYSMVGNSALKESTATTQTTTQNYSTNSALSSLLNKSDEQTLRLGRISVTDPNANMAGGPFRFNPSAPVTNIGDQMLTANTLFAPVYPASNDLTKLPAYNYIQLAGGLFLPVSTMDLNKKSLTAARKNAVLANAEYQKYMAMLRSYVAAQSIGANNLYAIMAERIPQENLGINAGVKDPQGKILKDASEYQLQQYLATRRSENPDWYKEMAAASPATVQRETLYVLAEMREQMFQMQQQNERLLATISVMQMQQNAQDNKINLMLQEQKLPEDVRPEDANKPASSTLTPIETGIGD